MHTLEGGFKMKLLRNPDLLSHEQLYELALPNKKQNRYELMKSYVKKKKSSRELIKFLERTMINKDIHSFYEHSQKLTEPFTERHQSTQFWSGKHSMEGEK